MRPSEQRLDPLRLFWRRAGMLVLAFLVAISMQAVWGVYKKERDSRILRERAEAEYADLSAREARLRADIAALKSERGLEAAIRDEYGMGKEGEHLIVIVEREEPEPVPEEKWTLRALREKLPF